MSVFLDYIVEDISAEELPTLHDKVFVFPTRRACIHFRKTLQEKFREHTFWSPEILSIEDFVVKISDRQLTDELTLIIQLYNIYHKVSPTITLDRFYSWGQVLISDFDEVDRYMADGSKLYQNLQEYHDIESFLGESEEMKQALVQFKKVVQQDDPTHLIKAFSETWSQVGKVYHEFQQLLAEQEMTYSGLLFKEVANKALDKTLKLPYSQVVFAGFNALSQSEEVLFDYIINEEKGTIYWDADELYLQNEHEEAGQFVRRYKRKWKGKNSKWVVTDYASGSASLNFVGTSHMVGQAKISSELLLTGAVPANMQTGLILADENMLFPTLYALPDSVREVNVTMGYPLSKSSLNQLVESCFLLHISKRGQGEKAYFKVREVIALLENPMLRSVAPQATEVIKWLKYRRSVWVSGAKLMDEITSTQLQAWFVVPEKSTEILGYLVDHLVKLFNAVKAQGNNPIELEYIYHYLKALKQLQGTIAENTYSADLKTIFKFIKETLKSVKVPFVGEPLEGLQIMGFLETRALDFENLIILASNEGNLPAGRSRITYIPHALRKAFKLPTFEELDAIYAYHFKRLLQRTKNAYVIYNTELAVDGSGEKSRYILQLQNALIGSKVKITNSVISQKVPLSTDPIPINVEKTAAVLELLQRFKFQTEDEPARLSPTTLVTYIECKLRFYFRHVLKLPEYENFSDDIDPREFGLIVHRALELIYANYEGETVSRDVLRAFVKDGRVEEVVKDAYKEQQLLKDDQLLEGRNLLNKGIIVRILNKVLDLDIRESPFTMQAVETKQLRMKMPLGDNEILLGGTVDRIDQDKHGVYRIIDYKTGITDMMPQSRRTNADYEEYIEEYFNNPKFKSGFQAYYYTYLFQKLFPGQKVKSGIFAMKEINKGVQFLRNGEAISPALIQEFEKKLIGLIQEIFNPEIEFSQTTDEKVCRYCAYKEICKR